MDIHAEAGGTRALNHHDRDVDTATIQGWGRHVLPCAMASVVRMVKIRAVSF